MHPALLTMRILGATPLVAPSSSIPRRSPLHLYKKAAQPCSHPAFPRDHSSSFLNAPPPTVRQPRRGFSSNFSRRLERDPLARHSGRGASCLLGFSSRSIDERGGSVFWTRAVSPLVSVIVGSVFEQGCFYRVGGGDYCRFAGFDLSFCRLPSADQRRYATGFRDHQPAAAHCTSATERRRMRGRGGEGSERSSRNSSPKRAGTFAEDGQSSLGGAPLTDLEKEKFKEVEIKQTNRLLTVPTILTLARVAAVPAILAVFYSGNSWATIAGAGIFVLAAVTDWLDGYLARKMGSSSAFGAFLDPVADKLMVAAALVLLCTKPLAIAELASIPWLLPLPTVAIIGREITMSAVREWAAAQGGDLHKAVAVSSLGKIKTASQMISITLLLASGEGGLDSRLAGVAGVALLYASAILALWSLTLYMKGISGSMFK